MLKYPTRENLIERKCSHDELFANQHGLFFFIMKTDKKGPFARSSLKKLPLIVHNEGTIFLDGSLMCYVIKETMCVNNGGICIEKK